MRPILRKIRERAARAADRTSATGAPAGQDGTQPQRASARDRGELRRRIRQLRRRRDALLLELARALDAGDRLDDLVSAGILGACSSCGTLLSTDARYCSQCGTAVGMKSAGTSDQRGNNGASNGSGQPAASEAGESAGVAGER